MIVMISESLLRRATATDGRILRDRVLSGFCVRLNARKRTFLIATSVSGKQFRMMLGYWPLMTVEDARGKAMDVLRQCRNGERPSRFFTPKVPTLREVLAAYCIAKGIKVSSQRRYESILRTHFLDWLDRSVSEMGHQAFFEHCHAFAQGRGGGLVEVTRGLIGTLIKFINAVHGLTLVTPFTKLSAAGLLPERAQPRPRKLQDNELPAWKAAVDKLDQRQQDYLYLTLYTGLRRNEGRGLQRKQIDLTGSVLSVPDTKNGKPHSLPITPLMRVILERRCEGLEPDAELFKGVSAEHISEMATRLGAPKFMLHDLRKLVATIGEKLKVGDAVLRRILNHTAPKSDVLHRHYVALNVLDITEPLARIQISILSLMEQVADSSRKQCDLQKVFPIERALT